MLIKAEVPTAYWTPDGLRDLNFDYDIYYTISAITKEFHPDLYNNVYIDLEGYFTIIIFKTFGFL